MAKPARKIATRPNVRGSYRLAPSKAQNPPKPKIHRKDA